MGINKDYTSYLLRTPGQTASFRKRYSRYISNQSSAYLKWILSWPYLEWMDFLNGVPEKNIPVVIGMICLIHIDGHVAINFNETATKVRRWWTPEEEKEFWTPDPPLRKYR